MSDELHIPLPGGAAGARAPVSSSYRPRRIDDGLVRRWVIGAAAGLGGVLVLGMVGWALVGRKPAVVPVIEADARPLRIKPENPGGMQFAGADEAVLGGTSTGADRVAPNAEVPAPQALRAQIQPPAAPATPAVPVVEAAPPAVPAAAPPLQAPVAAGSVPPGVSPLPDTPARPQAAAKPAAVAAVPVKPVPATGGTLVQLAALDSEAAAQAEWTRLSKRLPDLLGSRRLVVQKAERDGQAVWRVRTGGFADTAEASGFCGKLRAKGASCTVASF